MSTDHTDSRLGTPVVASECSHLQGLNHFDGERTWCKVCAEVIWETPAYRASHTSTAEETKETE
jgi:hypothetical protein